jgi:hypothetical protein
MPAERNGPIPKIVVVRNFRLRSAAVAAALVAIIVSGFAFAASIDHDAGAISPSSTRLVDGWLPAMTTIGQAAHEERLSRLTDGWSSQVGDGADDVQDGWAAGLLGD